MRSIGYARGSTDGQSLEAQMAALNAVGCERVFSEKVSGAKTNRRALARAIADLGPGFGGSSGAAEHN
jgi:DNA invertase Pin-like site-specific DNA recombinase